MKVKVLCGLIIIAINIFYSCRKPTTANWDTDVVLPIVNSKLNIKNFLGDSIFSSDNNGLIHISVSRTLTALQLDSVLKLPDTSIVQTFSVVFPTTLTPGQSLTFFPPTELEFNITNGVKISTFDVKKGIINIKYSNDLTQPLDLIYKLPGVTKYGMPYTINETVPPGINSLIKSYDLSGYNFNMRGLSGNVYNTIVQAYTVNVNPNASTVTATFGQGVKLNISYEDIIPQYAEGYFGQQTVDIDKDTTDLDIFNTFSASNLMLSDAKLNFKILNGFGVEFTGKLQNIQSINGTSVVALSTSQLNNININRATKIGTNVYPTVKTVSLNPSNSNILPFISLLPQKLVYEGEVNVNPLGNISGYKDFALYGNGLNVVADIDIPMQFKASAFHLQSISEVDFSKTKQLDNVNSANLILTALNGYPFSAKIQAYMLNSADQVIDSLMDINANTIAGGQINSLNIVTQPINSRINVNLSKQKLEKLRDTKKFKVKTTFIMPPNPPDIKFFDSYEIDVNFIAEINYNVKRN